MLGANSVMYYKDKNAEHNNGNIQIGDSSYELRAAKNRDTSEKLLEIPDLIGKRYYLIDQRNIGLENLVGNEGASLPPRKVENLHDRGTTGENRHYEKKQRDVYCTIKHLKE
ncbi:hypothetical protein CHS0354_013864 [Potamilus streckersoni]|uniref:Uncharacterized protein n=1 Tax=Potamilus streckersoni TaxID=2493646 RepID=A0AAE0W8I6_9BIVA|nr:hypothetical protein CHS0354_013864 [Potamilus streckersoni]